MASNLNNLPLPGAGVSRHEDFNDLGNGPPLPPYPHGSVDEPPPLQNSGSNGPGGRKLRSNRSPERPGVTRTNSEGYGRGGTGHDPRYDDPHASAPSYDRGSRKPHDRGGDSARDRGTGGSRASNLLQSARGFISSNFGGSEYGSFGSDHHGHSRDDRHRYHDRPAGHGGGGHPSQYSEPPPGGPARKDLMRELEQANEANRMLLDQVKALEDTCQQLKRRNDAMQSARDAQEELLGRQEPDSVVSAHFHDIFSQVKSWSSKFCRDASRPLDVSHVAKDQTLLVSRVVPSLQSLDDLSRLLPPGDIKRRRKFVRGWVALNVAEAMFRSLPAPRHTIAAGSDVWIPSGPRDGGPRDAIKTLEFILLQSGEAITRNAFHEWRAMTFGLFDKMYPPSRWPPETIPSIKEKAQSTVDLIKSLAPPGASLAELENRLVENVFIPAVELSQVLRRQRACWYVRFPHIMTANTLPHNDYVKPYVFNPDFMKDADSYGDEDDDAASSYCLKAVEIVITPSLFKSGNHDGEQYDIEFAVEKAEVSCSEIHQSGAEMQG